MNLCSLHFLGPYIDDWLLPYLIVSMYLDAFLEAFRVSNVTTLVFFCLGFGLLLLKFWCAPRFWLVWCSWSGAVLLCIWVDECASAGLKWIGCACPGMRCYIWTGLVHPGLRWCKLSGWACLGMRWCTWPEAGLAGLAWCTWSGSAMHARLRWCTWSEAEAMHAGLQTATNSWINAVCS